MQAFFRIFRHRNSNKGYGKVSINREGKRR